MLIPLPFRRGKKGERNEKRLITASDFFSPRKLSMAELIDKVVQQLGAGTVAADLLTMPESALLAMIEKETSAAFFVALGRTRRAAID
jgi:hypothetical protein